MTTAIAIYNPVFAFLSGDLRAYDCRVPMYFGKKCKECLIRKVRPTMCCDGPCETCNDTNCPYRVAAERKAEAIGA